MEHSDLEQVAQTLAEGFEYLLREIDTLSKQQQSLQSRLSDAHQQYNEFSQQYRSGTEGTSHLVPSEGAHGQSCPVEEHSSLPSRSAIYSAPVVIRAQKACEKVLRAPTSGNRGTRQCPLSKLSTMEQDFTTKGREGHLQCPFAMKSANTHGLPTPPTFTVAVNGTEADPIAAEFHPDAHSSSAASATHTNTVKCPIRFLERHSPEEVAQYFENHKHEIPRSHEICVKRYQKNSDSIRQLDAKYGNLVSMIQGLGVKHKQYFPEDELNAVGKVAGEVGEGDSGDGVKKWAEDVSHHSDVAPTHNIPPSPVRAKADELPSDEARTPHFERPLREIRVGESPSRPWGISVPIGSAAAESVGVHNEAASSIPAPVPANLGNESSPENHEATFNLQEAPGPEESRSKKVDSTVGDPKKHFRQEAKPGSMIFNGPTFFGYSPEQISQLMRSGTL